MENSILENLLVPWWKIVVYFLLAVLAAISIKVSFTFNLNTWQKDREEAKRTKELEKRSSECGHVWTLFSVSVYSQCNLCLAFIFTSTLLYARENFDPKPLIVAEETRHRISPVAGQVFAYDDYIGKRK